MKNSSDETGGWELAGAVRAAQTDRRWVLLGGWEDDDAVGLDVIVQHPTDPELVRRMRLRIPLLVDADGIVVGEVTVE